MSSKTTLRTSIVMAGLLAASAAQADITIPVNSLVVNCVQAFSDRAQKGFRASNVSLQALGNATQSGTTITFPVTKLVIGSGLKIVIGTAVGAALKLSRPMDDGSEAWIVLANLWLDYRANQVVADVTIPGAPTVKNATIYNFKVDTPLALKYKFPLSITGHEVLNKLMLTEQSKDLHMAGLQYEDYIRPGVLDTTDFGTLTQDLLLKFRSRPLSTKPYIVK
jgi:hypothetical protein